LLLVFKMPLENSSSLYIRSYKVEIILAYPIEQRFEVTTEL